MKISKLCLALSLLLLPACQEVNAGGAVQKQVSAVVANIPAYDHIVIVIEENKGYEQIIGNSAASYINNVLKAEGANLTKFYAEEHFSQGNYFWLFSGSNQNIGYYDAVPTVSFDGINLGEELIRTGHSFKGYSEDLPSIGSTVNHDGFYARKHVPWISFSNVPNGTTVATSSNLRFTDFPSNYKDLQTVSIVVPNLINDMHDASKPSSIATGDSWLQAHMDDYYQWAKAHNSLLIVTFDENSRSGASLTDPRAAVPQNRNRIATIIAGAHIRHGDYDEGNGVTHVNLLRTLEAMYHLRSSGAQQPHAVNAGITDDFVISDIFE